MLIVLLVLSLIMIGIGCYKIYKHYGSYCFNNGLGIALTVIGGILAFILLIVTIVGSVMISQSSIIDEKINVYETENTQIQEDVAKIVSEYAKWESDTYEKLKGSDPIFIVNMYPELKTSELVNTQIEIYMTNKQEIKKLKTNKLDYEVWRWWLYFG